MPISFFPMISGIILLLFGRRLFWLFVGCIGFVVGFHYASMVFIHQPGWMVLAIGFLIGIIGALIAVFLQHVAIGLSGFGAGGMIVARVMEMIGIQTGSLLWVSFFIGGVIGLTVMLLFFDWALIFLSSLVGSTMVIGFFHFAPPLNIIAFLVLMVVGILVQTKLFLADNRPRSGGLK